MSNFAEQRITICVEADDDDERRTESVRLTVGEGCGDDGNVRVEINPPDSGLTDEFVHIPLKDLLQAVKKLSK